MSSSDFMTPDDGVEGEAVVKWFNLSKGFGFVAPADGSPDAFMHVSVLARVGLQQIAEGTKLLVVVGDGPKGRQVLKIVTILGQGEIPPAAASAQHAAPIGPTEVMQGTVKWFKPEKGFGFVAPDDGGKDVFVHKSIVSRLGLVTLETGQRVKMDVHTANKGREAVSVELI